LEDLFTKLLDAVELAPRSNEAAWSGGEAWPQVLAGAAGGSAWLVMAAALATFLVRRNDLPFRPLGWLFVATITCCGAVQLAEIVPSWRAWQRVSSPAAAVTAALTWVAVLAAWRAVPQALALPNPSRINELLQIEMRERQRANERSRLVVELAPNAIVIANQNGRIVQVNARTEQYFGYERTEMVGQSVDALIPERFRGSRPGDLFAARAADGAASEPTGLELVGLRKDGSEFPIEVGVQPAVSERDVLMLVAIADVTLQKQAEAALKKLAGELQRSNGELAQFAYVASHDLKEPLRKVASFCQLLKERYRGKLDADGDRYIDYAVEGARRMQSLIMALLELSQVASSDRPLSPTDAAAACDVAIDNLRTAIDESGADVSHGPLPVVMGNETQLVQLFQNLIGNAIKFRGQRRPEVAIDAVPHDGEWLFSVRDNGIGIEPEHRDRVFGIFQRLHTREEYPGTGIGLAITKKIVERGGGRIWIDSVKGQGTTFHFTLPRRAAEVGPQAAARAAQETVAHAH
jgi:PAS domain S-box-containing protein